MSGWPTVEADLRRALLRAGRPAHVIEGTLTDLSVVWRAVEAARGRLEDDLVWALVAMAADHARRRALHERGRDAAG